ncbi:MULTISPECIES: rod shape-determining protein MreD [Pseudomonas]|uniref:rod shape-determining protein MreD n=1 Tax=Pseudomonas TaxID=286 RepID=UPI00123B1C05|nr:MULTISPECIES: rod shape-determining protein MreD [Pseudomonas]QIB50913.1 rod shape-determining protein MreD [Pseudomonas sp. OIL-1]
MRHSLVVGFTVLLALLLSVMPMPEPFGFGRPMWLAMTVAFWVMVLPHRIGLVMAWFAGLASDVLYGELFGQHALVMTLVATMVLLLYQRIRRFPLWQQSLVMLPVFGVAQLLLLWLNSLAGSRPPILLLLLPALVSALLWPWACAFLDIFRRRFHVV